MCAGRSVIGQGGRIAVADVEPVDGELVRRAVTGDDQAFATLVEHFDPLLRELVFRLLADRDAMDAALHTTYVKAYRGLPRLTPHTRPAAWICRIAYGACLDELRRRERQPRRRATDRVGGPPLAPGASVFDRAFASLSADQRVAVLLVDRAGFGLDLVSEVLDRPEPVVIRALRRARAILDSALDADNAPDELPFPGPT